MSPSRRFPPRADRGERTFVGDLLRQETVGGCVVLVAAVAAVLWANTPFSAAYHGLQHLTVGPLDLEHWAADGALTLFFFLAGLEVKREMVLGTLRRPGEAMVPITAALAGVATPALVYLLVNLPGGRPGGWAIPAATDIAFALAILAVVGSALPGQLRSFLLTLAVVDDLVVILVIALFYTSEVETTALLAAAGLLAVYAWLQRIRVRSTMIYLPLAVAVWWFTLQSGVHATVAGVAMGLLTRVRPDPGEPRSPGQRLEHRLTPVSAGVAVPFFALMSAGVQIRAGSLVGDPVVLGVVLGLLVGKPLGVMAGAWTVTRLTRAELNDALSWRDIFGVALLAGVGFTVALLVSELSLSGGQADAAKTAVLLASTGAGLLAALALGRRSRAHAAT